MAIRTFVQLMAEHQVDRPQTIGITVPVRGSFQRFLAEGWRDFAPPNEAVEDELSTVVYNAEIADEGLRQTEAHLSERGVQIGEREFAAAANVIVAAQTVEAALLLFLRADRWLGYPTLNLLRGATEYAARGIFIGLGTNDEHVRFLAGRRLKAVDYWPRIGTQLDDPAGGSPKAAYEALCTYAHHDFSAMRAGPPRMDDVLVSLGYVSWLCATAAEMLVGAGCRARWAGRWSDVGLPWLRP